MKKTKSKEDAQWQKAYRQAARMGVVLTRRKSCVPRAEGPRRWQKDHEGLPLEGMRRSLGRSARQLSRAAKNREGTLRGVFFLFIYLHICNFCCTFAAEMGNTMNEKNISSLEESLSAFYVNASPTHSRRFSDYTMYHNWQRVATIGGEIKQKNNF